MMPSHFANYIKERQGKEIIEDNYGFATYSFVKGDVYIEDIYVNPDARSRAHASGYADKIAEIAKERGCKNMIGTVVPSTNGSTTSLKVLLAYGFQLHSSANDFIVFKKEL